MSYFGFEKKSQSFNKCDLKKKKKTLYFGSFIELCQTKNKNRNKNKFTWKIIHQIVNGNLINIQQLWVIYQ